jgi:hypothetical protein
MYMENWSYTDMGKQKYLAKKNLSSAILSTTVFTQNGLGSKPGLPGDKTVTD